MRLSVLSLFLSLCALALTGCDMTADGNAPGGSNAVNIQGVVHGGQQAVVGGHIYLFAVNSIGSGGNGLAAASTNASVSLLNSGVATTVPPSTTRQVTTLAWLDAPILDRQSHRLAGWGGKWRAFPNAAGMRRA